jgi:hypothetical protein
MLRLDNLNSALITQGKGPLSEIACHPELIAHRATKILVS